MDRRPKSLCFQLPNLPGTLEPLVTELARASVNINSIVAHEGNLVLNVDRPDVLRSVLQERRIPFQETTACTKGAPTSTTQLAEEIRELVRQLTELAESLDRAATGIAAMPKAHRQALIRIAGDLSALAAL